MYSPKRKIRDIDQLILTMNLIGDNSLNYLG